MSLYQCGCTLMEEVMCPSPLNHSRKILDIRVIKTLLLSVIIFMTASFARGADILVWASNTESTYLGCLTCSIYQADSVHNQFGSYGSEFSSSSIFNDFGSYGSPYASDSACNPYTNTPPMLKDDSGAIFYGYLTVNEFQPSAVTEPNIVAWLRSAVCGIDGPTPLDTDQDGLANNFDIDDDGDSVHDYLDSFPLNSQEWLDSDGDGVGNNADTDDDNDSMPDIYELNHSLNPLDSEDAWLDSDGDGVSNYQEYLAGTDPQLVTSVPLGSNIFYAKSLADDQLSTMTHKLAYTNPVVITGIPSTKDVEPGVFRLSNITHNSFDFRFQEWDYLDGAHSEERIPFLIAETGRKTFRDGVVMEAGTFSLDGTGTFKAINFTAPFANAPYLLLTIQTNNDSSAIVVKAKDITTSGFSAALFEQQSLMDGHAIESIGYLAISHPYGDAVLEQVRPGNLAPPGADEPYALIRIPVSEAPDVMFSGGSHLEEESSADAEMAHTAEHVDLMSLDGMLFGQIVSNFDADPVSLREPVGMALRILSGSVQAGSNSVNVNVTNEDISVLADPIVIVGVPTDNDTDPGVVRVSQIVEQGFNIKFQEWDYRQRDFADTSHALETIDWLMIEPGHTTLSDGSVWEAGRTYASDNGFNGVVSFQKPFANPPKLFLTVQTSYGTAVSIRAQNVTTTGFQVNLNQEEALTDPHISLQIGYLAIDAPLDQAQQAAIGLNETLSYQLKRISAGHAPLRVGPAELYTQEEQSADIELDHDNEQIDVLIINGHQLFAQDVSALDSDSIALRQTICVEQDAHAWNPQTGQEGDYANNCDVPQDWTQGSPPDTDLDGMNDAYELRAGLDLSNPQDASTDLDNDGLTNLDEFLAGTDPNNEDTDTDGIPDKYEIDYGLNPLSEADGGHDMDSDGASNFVEYQENTNPTDASDFPAWMSGPGRGGWRVILQPNN